MQLGILTRDSEVPSTARLCQAARAQGLEPWVLPILRTTLTLSPQARLTVWEPELSRHREIPSLDVVIPRIGTVFPQHALSLLRRLEEQGCRSFNTSDAIATSNSKVETLARAAQANIPIPPTVLVKDLEQVGWAIAEVGGPPVVIKPSQGLQGRRIVLAESTESAESVVEAFLLFNQEVLIQRFVAEAGGEDLRVWVLRDRVVAAMRRQAREGSFRANVHAGAQVSPAEVTDTERELAIAAAQCVGLRWAGVDLIPSQPQPLLLEVNASPGLEGIEKATQRDLASEVIESLGEWYEEEGA